MRKFYFVVSLLIVLMLAPIAMADQVSIGSTFGPYQTGGGGEFTLSPDAQLSWILNTGYVDGITKNVPTFPGTFQTFCVEDTEPIYPKATYDARISDHSIYKNVVLTKGAAYLYRQFQIGQLQGYDYTRTATPVNETQELQDAIWYFMGVAINPTNQFSILGLANGGFALNNGLYPVAVLNLWKAGHVGDINFRIQDVLIGTNPVPEPATMLLLGSGLLGLAGIARKRFRKK